MSKAMNVMFTRLSTTELASFANQVILSSKNGNYKNTSNDVILVALEKEYQQYSQLYTKLSYSGKGKDVQRLDAERSKAYNILRNLVKAYKDATMLANYQEASKLYLAFQTHSPKIAGLGYSEKSALLKKLVEELDSEANQASLTALGFTEVFNALKTANEEFVSLHIKQAEANAELRLQMSASYGRKNLEKALRNYLTYLSVMKDTSKEWSSIYADVNELVKYHSANIKSQITRRKNKTDKLLEGNAGGKTNTAPLSEDANKPKTNTRPSKPNELPIHTVVVEGEESSASEME